MTHAEQMRYWAKRRQEAARLRDKDPEYWTFRVLAEKFDVSPERIRQWIRKEKANGKKEESKA